MNDWGRQSGGWRWGIHIRGPCSILDQRKWGWEGTCVRDTVTSACQQNVPSNSSGFSKTCGSPCMLLSGGSFSFIYQTTDRTVPRGMICILLHSQCHVQILHPPLSFVPVKLLPFHSSTLNLPTPGSHLLAFCLWLHTNRGTAILTHFKFHVLPRCVFLNNYPHPWE